MTDRNTDPNELLPPADKIREYANLCASELRAAYAKFVNSNGALPAKIRGEFHHVEGLLLGLGHDKVQLVGRGDIKDSLINMVSELEKLPASKVTDTESFQGLVLECFDMIGALAEYGITVEGCPLGRQEHGKWQEKVPKR